MTEWETVVVGTETSCTVSDDGVETCITITYTEEQLVTYFEEDCSDQEMCYDECWEEVDDDDSNNYSLLPGGGVPACAIPLLVVETT